MSYLVAVGIAFGLLGALVMVIGSTLAAVHAICERWWT